MTGYFTPSKITSCIHRVQPRAGLDCPESNPVHPALNQLQHTELFWSLTNCKLNFLNIPATFCKVAMFVTQMDTLHITFKHKKVKVHPRKGHEGSEGEQRYSSTLCFNLGARWRWVVNGTPRPLYLRATDPVPIL